MKKTIFFSKRLDDSPESVKDSKNNDTQTASQTTANGQAEKESRWTCKRIGLFAVLVLTGIATMLTPSLIEQAGAWFTIDEDGNERSGSSPAAVPAPVVVVAKPLLKKGAIVAGKWLIAVLAEYGVHTAIDKVFEDTEGQEATVTVHGSRWLSHEYSHEIKTPTPSIPPYGGNWTTTATMGDRDVLASAEGWWGNLNQAMTQDEAIDILDRKMAKVSVVNLEMSYWDPTARVRGRSGRLYPVVVIGYRIRAKESHLAFVKSRALQEIRRDTGNPRIVWYKELQRETFKWNVGSFGMFSDFVDPAPILKKLGTENAIDSEANYYEATATWRYRNLAFYGTWRKWYNGKKTFSQETGDGIKSWEDHHFSYDFCKNGQEIIEPAIYEGIRRFISKRPVLEQRRRTGQSRRLGEYHWVRVGWEPVVAQEYQDLD